jgi:hypothetical protein
MIKAMMASLPSYAGRETMLPYIIALLCRETEGGTYGNQ